MFWDVIYLEGLNEDCALPVGSLLEARRRIIDSHPIGHPVQSVDGKALKVAAEPDLSWGLFKYVYFTEGDQILMIRKVRELYEWMDANRRAIVTPHRLGSDALFTQSLCHPFTLSHSHSHSQSY